MSDVIKLTRKELAVINDDPRWIRAMERLFDLVPVETDLLSGRMEIVEFEAALASAKAQQAIDNLPSEKSYGVFFDTTNQSALSVNTPTAVTLNSTQEAKNISISGSQMTVIKSGTYKIEISVQL